jgi:hypothetical protein
MGLLRSSSWKKIQSLGQLMFFAAIHCWYRPTKVPSASVRLLFFVGEFS